MEVSWASVLQLCLPVHSFQELFWLQITFRYQNSPLLPLSLDSTWTEPSPREQDIPVLAILLNIFFIQQSLVCVLCRCMKCPWSLLSRSSCCVLIEAQKHLVTEWSYQWLQEVLQKQSVRLRCDITVHKCCISIDRERLSSSCSVSSQLLRWEIFLVHLWKRHWVGK